MYDIFLFAYTYLKNNIILPKAAYQTPLIVWPSVRGGVFRFADLFTGIHPNYIGVALLFTCVLCFMYIKIKYPFWNGQPVYHSYDFWRGFYHSPYVMYSIPIKTKYYDKQQLVHTHKVGECDKAFKTRIVELLECHYISSDKIIYNLEERDFTSYFTGQNEPSYITVLNEFTYTPIPLDSSSNISFKWAPSAPTWKDLLQSPQIQNKEIGCVTSRHVHLVIWGQEGKYHKYDAYFQDFLCLHRDKKKNIRTLFDTHEYNIRVRNPDIKVSIFRQEISLIDGVVPLTQYTSYFYFLRNKVGLLGREFTLSRVNKNNNDVLIDLWGGLLKTNVYHDCLLYPDIGNILSLIKSRNMWVYCLKRKEDILAAYFFKNAHTNYEEMDDSYGNGGHTLQLVASINNTSSHDLFYTCFTACLGEISKENPYFKILMIDCIGHNNIINQMWNNTHDIIISVPSAYYAFNFIIPTSPITNARCFILT
jgi:hypothetical protein